VYVTLLIGLLWKTSTVFGFKPAVQAFFTAPEASESGEREAEGGAAG